MTSIHDVAQRIAPVDASTRPRAVMVAMRPLIIHASSKSHSDNAQKSLAYRVRCLGLGSQSPSEISEWPREL